MSGYATARADRKHDAMPLFAVATLTPFALCLIAALWGGIWTAMALGYVTLWIFVLDRHVTARCPDTDPQAGFRAATVLLVVLALAHFGLLALCLGAVAGATGLDPAERATVALTGALIMGQIAHPVAHELIHRPSRALRRLGLGIYTSLLFGHHASAHLLVHHKAVGTEADPASARRGEGFYRYALRAWACGFRDGLRAETRRNRRAGRPVRRHPYALYLGGATMMLTGTALTLGTAGLAALVFIAGHAQMQVLLADYVQHYGLRRARLPDGRLEPVGPQHSWNAPHWYSAAMMLNAPRHSDHHIRPSRPYPALQLTSRTMPCLPHALPVMAALALVPPLWRRVMDSRCAHWAKDRPCGAKSTGPTARDLPI